MNSVEHSLKQLGSIATVADARAAARKGVQPSPRPKTNIHIHLPPNFSAFESVAQAVELAAQQGVKVVGASNYYDYAVYGEYVSQARKHGVFPLFGLEIIAMIEDLRRAGVKLNDPGNPGKLYICGKGITRFAPFSAEAERLIAVIRRNDTQRMAEMVRRMEMAFAAHGVSTGLTLQAVTNRIVARHGCRKETVYPQERHLAQAFQEVLFEKVPAAQRLDKLTAILGARPKSDNAVKVQNDIRSHLMKAGKPAFVEEQFLDFEQANRLILELGGIPCYPTLADGTTPVCPFEEPVAKLIGNIQKWNVWCVEFIPLRNKPDVLARYVKAMRAAGLVVTAGTEHNTLDLVPLEPQCAGGAAVPDEIKEIFWEGVCVVAAHQFLCLHGECGFVDGQGKPNPAYKDANERIAAFHKLGAAVVQRYFEQSAE